MSKLYEEFLEELSRDWHVTGGAKADVAYLDCILEVLCEIRDRLPKPAWVWDDGTPATEAEVREWRAMRNDQG